VPVYRPEAFEPLTDEPWSVERVRSAIRAIVADADEHFDASGLWPANESDAWSATPPLKDLHVGGTGVILALDVMRRRGLAETRVDLRAATARTLDLMRERLDLADWEGLPRPAEPSLFCGETGPLLLSLRFESSWEIAGVLADRIRQNVDNDAEELMWGAAGTLLAASFLRRWGDDERWDELSRNSANALSSRRDADGLWTQRLGRSYRFLGPAHGFVGNVHALLQVDSGHLAEESAAVLASTAVVEDGLANWPAVAGDELQSRDGQIRLQWCHGAPGVVATAAPYLDEELLLAGAELTWRAGAHGPEKGPGLCHGTAGNGYALLKTFERTGDERWLERARRFAVHALGQVERTREEVGHGRYSLFTGDLGVALFASSCLDVDARFPVLDAWD
jgi:lanthionine synthetase-like protein